MNNIMWRLTGIGNSIARDVKLIRLVRLLLRHSYSSVINATRDIKGFNWH